MESKTFFNWEKEMDLARSPLSAVLWSRWWHQLALRQSSQTSQTYLHIWKRLMLKKGRKGMPMIISSIKKGNVSENMEKRTTINQDSSMTFGRYFTMLYWISTFKLFLWKLLNIHTHDWMSSFGVRRQIAGIKLLQSSRECEITRQPGYHPSSVHKMIF